MESSEILPVSPTRTAMTVGAFTAAVMLVVSTLGWQMTGWLMFLGGIYWGMRRFKNECGGMITWFRAMNAGLQTAFFASLILAFVAYMATKLDPSIIPALLDVVEKQLKTSGFPEGLTEMAMQQWREILSPMVFALIIIFMYSSIGCVISIFCAFFVQTAKPVNQ